MSTEQEFARRADAELAALEAALEAAADAGAEIDIELKPGGILELECADGSKIILNRHGAAREIWLAARSGGYHFGWQNDRWLSARDGSELWAVLVRCLGEQCGEPVALRRPG